MKSLLVLAIVCAPALVSAQGYYGPPGYSQGPVPGGFHRRAGHLTVGVGIGLGGMSDDTGDIDCPSCDFNPLALEADFHIGGMLSHRLALLFEAQVNSQQVDSSFVNGDTFLTQGAALFAAQFWLIPQLWIKGGIGFANLQVDNDVFGSQDVGGGGGALMGAIGVELLSARNFAVDLQGRVIEGLYSDNYHVTSGTIGIGLDWY